MPESVVISAATSGDDVEFSQRFLNVLYQIPKQPSAEADQAAEAIDPSISCDEGGNTQVEDLRKRLMINIDPEICRDVDDALSIHRQPTGGFLVGSFVSTARPEPARDGRRAPS